MGACCFSKHEISNGVCCETGMRTDFQQCHTEGAKLQEGESFTSIKLSHYTNAFCDDSETELDNSFTHIGEESASGQRRPATESGGYGNDVRNTENFTSPSPSPATKPLYHLSTKTVPIGPLLSTCLGHMAHAGTAWPRTPGVYCLHYASNSGEIDIYIH